MQHGMFDDNDQREVRRRHLIYNLAAIDQDSGEPLGRVADITHDGVMLISAEPLPVDREYRIRLSLPEQLSDAPELAFRARSRWCRPDVNTDYYDTGFQLLEVTEEHARTVRHLVSIYGFDD